MVGHAVRRNNQTTAGPARKDSNGGLDFGFIAHLRFIDLGSEGRQGISELAQIDRIIGLGLRVKPTPA